MSLDRLCRCDQLQSCSSSRLPWIAYCVSWLACTLVSCWALDWRVPQPDTSRFFFNPWIVCPRFADIRSKEHSPGPHPCGRGSSTCILSRTPLQIRSSHFFLHCVTVLLKYPHPIVTSASCASYASIASVIVWSRRHLFSMTSSTQVRSAVVVLCTHWTRRTSCVGTISMRVSMAAELRLGLETPLPHIRSKFCSPCSACLSQNSDEGDLVCRCLFPKSIDEAAPLADPLSPETAPRSRAAPRWRHVWSF